MTKPSLEETVSNWLVKTGLPLELDAAAAFDRAGFHVEHSSVYVDPESEKGREIDVIAHTRDPSGMIQIYVVAECKSSSNPWVVLVDQTRSPMPTYAWLGVTSEDTQLALPDDLLTSRSPVGRLLRSAESNGYSLRQAFSGEKDLAYAATMSAVKASWTLAKPETGRFAFAIPVIVVDSPIFLCSTNAKSGALELRQVKSTQFKFSAYIPKHVSCVVRIVTRGGVTALAYTLRRYAEELKVAMQFRVDAWIKSLKK